jgi:soluble lytic murein transglycosylase-like protein
MRPTIAVRRAASGVVALALCAQALTQVLQREEPKRETEAPAARVARAERRSWSLRVDGWKIEVDPGQIERRAAAYRQAEDPPSPPLRATDALLAYEPLIAKYAEAAGIDWRLVSALIHEESGFRPNVESSAGAYGLMQVREIAAQDVGETEFRDPESNIRTGVRYLQRLDEMFADVGEGRDRLAIVLAAYNMGPAHVWDAQALASRYGYNPRVWDGSMAAIVPLLEDPRFYDDLPAGFAQGRRTVAYVERVLKRFDAYRRSLTAVPPSLRRVLVP